MNSNITDELFWKELRNKFFIEHTQIPKGRVGLREVNTAPHDLFEWFKAALSQNKVDDVGVGVKWVKASEIIPAITHPLGRSLRQPNLEVIFISETHAKMKKKDADLLYEYSTSFPSGVYEGKMWKAKYGNKLFLRWLDICKDDPEKCSNYQREIIFEDESIPKEDKPIDKVSDAVEFAEWAYDNNWLIQSDKNWWNFQAELDKQVEIPTTELYEIYLQSLQLKK